MNVTPEQSTMTTSSAELSMASKRTSLKTEALAVSSSPLAVQVPGISCAHPWGEKAGVPGSVASRRTFQANLYPNRADRSNNSVSDLQHRLPPPWPAYA